MAKITEKEELDRVQKGFALIKSGLENIQKINNDGGRGQAACAAMSIRGRAVTLHADASLLLYEYWPDAVADGLVIQPKGGGGGR